MQVVKDAMKSKETTVAGILGAVAIVAGVLQAHFDGDPETVPVWNNLFLAVMAAYAGIRARDWSVNKPK